MGWQRDETGWKNDESVRQRGETGWKNDETSRQRGKTGWKNDESVWQRGKTEWKRDESVWQRGIEEKKKEIYPRINTNLTNLMKKPRFLVQYLIFKGMDNGHFITLYQFLEKQKQQNTFTDNFSEADLVTMEKIESEAILVLLPERKLLGDF